MDMNDFHLKLSNAVDRSKWREMIGGNWIDNSEVNTNCIFLVPFG